MKYPEIKKIAGKLRKNPTASEKIFWEIIRNRRLGGYRFLRQHPLYYEHKVNEHFFFVPDFYCAEIKLIIELDGGIHLQQKERDSYRDDILKSKGFKILRIYNEDLTNIESVKERIFNFIEMECTK